MNRLTGRTGGWSHESRRGSWPKIVSPSSRTIDFVRKPYRYLEFGVPAYWVLDPPGSRK
jgi:hypothetical protein